jgi:hypothetical protein
MVGDYFYDGAGAVQFGVTLTSSELTGQRGYLEGEWSASIECDTMRARENLFAAQ